MSNYKIKMTAIKIAIFGDYMTGKSYINFLRKFLKELTKKTDKAIFG